MENITGGKNESIARSGTGWFPAPAVLMLDKTISKQAKLIWINFASHANRRSGACFPSAETQAEEMDISRPSVNKARQELIAEGWLLKEQIKNEAGKIVRMQWTVVDKYDSTRQENHPKENTPGGKTAYEPDSKYQPQEVKPSCAGAPAPGATTKLGSRKDADIMAVFQAMINTGLNKTQRFANKSERQACQDLVRAHGVAGAVNLVGVANLAVIAKRDGVDRFAPIATTAYDIAMKATKLEAWFAGAMREAAERLPDADEVRRINERQYGK